MGGYDGGLKPQVLFHWNGASGTSEGSVRCHQDFKRH
jgi:hypothetical protein